MNARVHLLNSQFYFEIGKLNSTAIGRRSAAQIGIIRLDFDIADCGSQFVDESLF